MAVKGQGDGGPDREESQVPNVQLSDRSIAMLQLLARRVGLKDWSVNDLVMALASNALAEDECKNLTSDEIMQRTYAKWEKNDPFRHMTEEEFLRHAGNELRKVVPERDLDQSKSLNPALAGLAQLDGPDDAGTPKPHRLNAGSKSKTPLQRIQEEKGPKTPERK